ncbi:MAG: histidine phosphatase family protein [Thermoplasmatota archaeon]
MKKRLHLMRHGQAEKAPGQSAADLFSLGDRPLSETGRAQAELARAFLADAKVEAAFASPRARAQETARIVAAPHGLGVETDAGLDEMPIGKEARGYDHVLAEIVGLARRLKEDADPMLDGHARYGETKARFASAVARALDRHDCVLVVAHGISNRVWLAETLGMPPHALFRIDQPHACVAVVDFEDHRPTLLRLWSPQV